MESNANKKETEKGTRSKIGKHARRNLNRKESRLIEKANKLQKKQTKQTAAPLKLNRRMRKEEREAELKSLEALTITDPSPQQENLSSNWKILQKVLQKEQDNSISSTKRKFKSSTNDLSMKPKNKKRQRLSSDPSNYVNGDKVESDVHVALIDQISKSDDGKKSAWFNKVDSALLDDDINVSDFEDCSDGEDSAIEDDTVVEFDMDAYDRFVDKSDKKVKHIKEKKQKEIILKKMTEPVALDCEMVGTGFTGSSSALARASIVDKVGKVIYDKYVKPKEEVTDYRTKWSGITAELLENATDFMQVQLEVSHLIKGKLLIGHSIHHDLSALLLSHPAHLIRDIATYQTFRSRYSLTPSLKVLSKDFLGMDIQKGPHDSVEDASATMKLYMSEQKKWENLLAHAPRSSIKKMARKNVLLVKGTRRRKRMVKNSNADPKSAIKKKKSNQKHKKGGN